MNEQNYNFTWQTYSDHLKVMMREIMSSNDFADVTIVTNDKKSLKAHRNILSACSPVFKSIFQMQPTNNNPVIFLKGIEHSEMERILQFVYTGEAECFAEQIKDFLMVAKSLGIKELNSNEDFCGQSGSNNTLHQEKEGVKSEAVDDHHEDVNTEDWLDEGDTEGQTPINSEADYTRSECKQCLKSFANQHILKNHIKSVHEGLKYDCDQCEKQYTEKGNLTRHVKSTHNSVKHACDYCQIPFTIKGNLDRHIQKMHARHVKRSGV